MLAIISTETHAAILAAIMFINWKQKFQIFVVFYSEIVLGPMVITAVSSTQTPNLIQIPKSKMNGFHDDYRQTRKTGAM